MNRTQLRNLIDSGRAIAMDCYAIGRKIDPEDTPGPLFQTDILNKTVILKRYENTGKARLSDAVVDTIVFFPYDTDNPYEGGESVNFSAPGFQEAVGFKIAKTHPTPELKQQIAADTRYLDLFDSLHSLDPFLFKMKAEQIEIHEDIHELYFAISKEEWERIRIPIREKISKLVTKALGEGAADEDDEETLSREQYVERFLTKIWEAKDIDGIEPFVDAMQISAEKAPEVFFAWKAVCYFQVRFREMESRLRKMFQWVGDDSLCSPRNSIGLLPEEQRTLRIRRRQIREQMRDSYEACNKLIGLYERSYDAFVENDNPQAFIGFLDNSERSYLTLATHVSIATHCLKLWEQYIDAFGLSLRNEQFFELFDALVMLCGHTQSDPDEEEEDAYEID